MSGKKHNLSIVGIQNKMLRVIFSSTSILTLISYSASTDWNIQLCFFGKTVNVSRSSCESLKTSQSFGGVWFSEPVKISRACFSPGVWALYKEWCQENPMIWMTGVTSTGGHGCMERKMLEKVAGIMFLGPDSGGVAVSAKGQNLFLESLLDSGPQSWTTLDTELSLVSWGPSASYILKVTTEDAGTVYHCLAGGKSLFGKQYKITVRIETPLELSLQPGNCSKAVATMPRNLKIVRASSHLPNKASVLGCSDLSKCPNSSALASRVPCQWTRSPEMIQRKINQQTNRLGLKFQAYMFKAQKFPSVTPTAAPDQWKLMELSKTLFKKVCPDKIVSNFFVENIFLLGRFLYDESSRLQARPAMNPQTFQRIEKTLTNCTRTVKPFEFQVAEPCTNQSRILISVVYLNGTKGHAPDGLPEDIRNFVDSYDLVLEVSWKLFLNAHYACANYFTQVPSDLSEFYVAWKELMSRDLMERWVNPGKSFDLMRFLFATIDLTKAVRNLDYCVGATHSQSVYHGWLKRPFQVKHTRKLIFTRDSIWNGLAYCADTYAYPALRLGYPMSTCGLTWPGSEISQKFE